jgi:hypothetical protein
MDSQVTGCDLKKTDLVITVTGSSDYFDLKITSESLGMEIDVKCKSYTDDPPKPGVFRFWNYDPWDTSDRRSLRSRHRRSIDQQEDQI